MQFSVPGIVNASAEANKANGYPDIRLFSVGQGTQSKTPLTNLATVQVQGGKSRGLPHLMPLQPLLCVRVCRSCGPWRTTCRWRTRQAAPLGTSRPSAGSSAGEACVWGEDDG